MTTAQPMPVIPNPESNEVLFQMLKLILNHPSSIHIPAFGFEIPPKEMVYFLDSEWKESWEKGNEVLRRTYPEGKLRKYFDLPNGNKNIKKVLELVESINNKDLSLFPQELKGEFNKYTIEILDYWKDFSLLEVVANVSANNRKLEIGYYPNSNEFLEDRFCDKEGYLSHLSKPFINLFQQFKVLFNSIWKDRYIILPEISDRKERALILSELRKDPHNPENFKKISEFY